MEKLRVGLIGCGFISTTAHIPALQQLEELEVVALADVSNANLERARKVMGLPESSCYSNYEQLLVRRDVDFIVIAVPDALHCPIAIDAVQAGKHVLCEKPLAISLAEADRMIATARSERVKMAVLHNFLFYPESQLVGQLLRSGELGKVRATWIHAFGLGMDIDSFARYAGAREPWLYNLSLTGGGAWSAYGIHAAYLTTHYFGESPLRVDAVINKITARAIAVEDYVHCRIEFPSGFGTIHLALHPADYTESRALQVGGAAIIADQGTIEFVYRGRGEAPHTAVQEVIVRTAEAQKAYPMPFSETKAKLISSFREVIKDFVESIREDREPLTSAETQGRKNLELIAAGYQSAVERRAVALPLSQDSPVYRKGVFGLAELNHPSGVQQLKEKKLYGVK